MADVLFRYLLAARAHDRAWYQRAFFVDERQLAASLERLIETAALRIELVSQHERVTTSSVTAPASSQQTVDFYDQPYPQKPVPGVFETRTERFALRPTLSVNTCDACRGAGVIDCSCNGTGRIECDHCSGSGRAYEGFGVCRDCNGDGYNTCTRCRGRGFFKHEECNGEGRLARWQEEVHTYSVKRARDALLPPESPLRAMAAAADEWLGKSEETFVDLSEAGVSDGVGYSTPELLQMISAARKVEANFKQKAQTDPEDCLFTVTRLQSVPVSACVLRSEHGERSDRFWLVGRGEQAIEIRPPMRLDPWKAVGWPGLAAGGAAATALLLPSAAPTWLTASGFGSVTFSLLASIGLPVAGVGLKRFALGGAEPVRTIAVIPCNGRPTNYLTCLPTLGGYLHRLEMRDRSFKASIESMMGTARPAHQSQTVVVRTERKELVRLIEIPQAEKLSRAELARMMEAVNGVLFLEEFDEHADTLRAEMHAATATRPPEVRLLIEPGQIQADEHGLGPSAGVALEAIRRAWTRLDDRAMDWAAVFERLWSPVSMLLSGLRVPLSRRSRRRLLAGGGR